MDEHAVNGYKVNLDSASIAIVSSSRSDSISLIGLLSDTYFSLLARQIENVNEIPKVLSEEDWDLVIVQENALNQEQFKQFFTPASARLPVLVVSEEDTPESYEEYLNIGARDVVARHRRYHIVECAKREIQSQKQYRKLCQIEKSAQDILDTITSNA